MNAKEWIEILTEHPEWGTTSIEWEAVDEIHKLIEKDKSNWVPCNEKKPENLQEVIVTFINKRPPIYYKNIRNVPMIGFMIYYKGEWYWWSSVVYDLLAEYGQCDSELVDKDIEITAWMPLPEPYRGEE